MALYGQGFSLRSLLEDPNLQNPPNLNKVGPDLKKGGKLGGYVNNSSSAFLGSNLWDKPSNADSNSNDFDLEYMDLDEFLSENGIPVNPDENDESQTISLLASALARSPPRSPNPVSPSALLIDPMSPSNPRSVNVGDEADKMTTFSNVSSPVGQPSSPMGHIIGSPQRVQEKSSQSVIERYLLDDDFGIKMPSPKTECKTEVKESSRKRKLTEMDSYSVGSPEMGVVSIPVYRPSGGIQQPSPLNSMPSPHWEPQGHDHEDSCSEDGTDFINNMIPGQDGFDPKARKFSSEELKPQPIIKKAKKVFVHDCEKDEKYWQRRKKNNVAAKRSREARRVKENQIAMRAAFLEEENDKLRKSYERIQRENESLMKRLSKYESLD